MCLLTKEGMRRTRDIWTGKPYSIFNIGPSRRKVLKREAIVWLNFHLQVIESIRSGAQSDVYSVDLMGMKEYLVRWENGCGKCRKYGLQILR